MLISCHPAAQIAPISAGESPAGCSTPPEQLAALFEAARRYCSFKYWEKVRVGSSESRITGQGFNAVKFDPRKPARTIRRNDGNLGMHGAMHWVPGTRRVTTSVLDTASANNRQMLEENGQEEGAETTVTR